MELTTVSNVDERVSAGTAPTLTGRIPCLDGLRAISILLVLLGHASMSDGAPRVLSPFNHIGNLGVRFFFVISGFLITTLLLKEWKKTGTISLRQFYLRRSLRIFPAAYFFIGVIGLLAVTGRIVLKPGELFYAAVYLMNYHDFRAVWLGQLWSLAVEEQFYLLWPGLLLLAGKRKAFRSAWGVILLVPVLRACMWFWWGASETAMTKHFEAVADSLATGCLLAAYYNRLGASARYLRLQTHTVLYLAACVGLIVFGNALYLVRPGAFYIWGQTLANIGTGFCMDWVIRHADHRIGRMLSLKPLVGIGVLSYSLYLWQNPFLLGGMNNFWTSYPQNIFFTFAAALLSYFAIERPFLRFKDIMGKRRARGANAA